MSESNIMQFIHKKPIVYSVIITQTWNGECHELDIAVDGLGDPPTSDRQEALIEHLEYAIRIIKKGRME